MPVFQSIKTEDKNISLIASLLVGTKLFANFVLRYLILPNSLSTEGYVGICNAFDLDKAFHDISQKTGLIGFNRTETGWTNGEVSYTVEQLVLGSPDLFPPQELLQIRFEKDDVKVMPYFSMTSALSIEFKAIA